MIEQFEERFHRLADLVVIVDPADGGIDLPFHTQFHLEAVAVHVPALVPFRHIGKRLGSLEFTLKEVDSRQFEARFFGQFTGTDFVLQPELREFQAEYGPDSKTPKVRVRINVKLIKMPERRIAASETFERIMEAPDNRMPVIVKTFDQALGKVMRDLVVWTLERGE